MSGHFWLTDAQVERLGPFFPKSRRLIRGPWLHQFHKNPIAINTAETRPSRPSGKAAQGDGNPPLQMAPLRPEPVQPASPARQSPRGRQR